MDDLYEDEYNSLKYTWIDAVYGCHKEHPSHEQCVSRIRARAEDFLDPNKESRTVLSFETCKKGTIPHFQISLTQKSVFRLICQLHYSMIAV